MSIQVCMSTNACRCLQVNCRDDPWIISILFYFIFICLSTCRSYKCYINRGWMWEGLQSDWRVNLCVKSYLYIYSSNVKLMRERYKNNRNTWEENMSNCRPTVPHGKSTPINHRAMASTLLPHHASHKLCTNTEVRQNPVHDIIISTTMHALMFSRAWTSVIYIFFCRFVYIAHYLKTK